jgi:hypothetical protein
MTDLQKGDKVKQQSDMVTVWQGPNATREMNSERVYVVSEVFNSEFDGKPHLLATDGSRHTGGPVTSYIRA